MPSGSQEHSAQPQILGKEEVAGSIPALGSADLRAAAKVPKAQAGLAVAGQKLWRSVTDVYDLETYEESLLLQAARCADVLDRLSAGAASGDVTVESHRGDMVAHPALTEGRQQAIVLSRLLASLRLPSGEEFGDVRPQRRGASRGTYGVRGVV